MLEGRRLKISHGHIKIVPVNAKGIIEKWKSRRERTISERKKLGVGALPWALSVKSLRKSSKKRVSSNPLWA
jgi:hypothetical protein